MDIIERLKTIWNHKWGKRIIIAAPIVFVLSIPMHCAGPYKGKVIDRDTGQPIAGVVAVGTWSSQSIHPAGGSSHCQDAREAVTDENGEFVIKGIRSRFLGLDTFGMRINVYKVGYKRAHCYWEDVEKSGACFQKPGGFEDGMAIFPLKRVAKGKLRSAIGRPPHISCGRKDGKPLTEYIKVHKEYRKAIGVKP